MIERDNEAYMIKDSDGIANTNLSCSLHTFYLVVKDCIFKPINVIIASCRTIIEQLRDSPKATLELKENFKKIVKFLSTKMYCNKMEQR